MSQRSMSAAARAWVALADGFREGFRDGERRAVRRAILRGVPFVALSLELTCRCATCRVDRDITLSRVSQGGRVLPLATVTDDGSTYAAETKEPCECGERRIVIRLRAPRRSSAG